jgi:hypothetical protein
MQSSLRHFLLPPRRTSQFHRRTSTRLWIFVHSHMSASCFLSIITISFIIALNNFESSVAFIHTNSINTSSRTHQLCNKIMSSNKSPEEAPTNSAAAAIDFLTLTRSLKTTRRTGWVMSGVTNPESIADHSKI